MPDSRRWWGRRFRLPLFLAVCTAAPGQPTVEVTARTVSRTIRLPGELRPFESVAVHARVTGFVERVLVDRGSVVQRGDLLATLSAPEMDAQIAESRARVEALGSERAEAEARLLAAQNTCDRLAEASKTPGAIAANELVAAEKAVEAARAAVRSKESAIAAARASVKSLEELKSYLEVRAPFDGVVVERLVHPGALAGPGGGAQAAGPLFRLEQLSRLRAEIAVPENAVAGIVRGATVEFSVPAYPDRKFRGRVARIAHSLDEKTRTMAVELDVENASGALAPGMYAEAAWPVRTAREALLVPPSSIVTTTERTFVIRVRNGRAEWVDVRRGAPAGDLVEVFGALKPGDRILQRGSDEIREGTPIRTAS